MTSNAVPRVSVIVVAAGSGTRLGADVPKAFVALGGVSLLERSLHAVAGMREPVQAIVVAPPALLDDTSALSSAVGAPSVTVVAGGTTRQQSVALGLAHVADSVEVVLVHDAARALAPSTLFDRIVAEVDARGHGVIPGLPVSDTIKRVDAHGDIHETVDRSVLSAVQTPQGFPRAVLEAAYAAAVSDQTDDAGLVTALGLPVSVIAGDELAFKVTTPADLQRAEQVVAGLPVDAFDRIPVPRVGIGTDTHAFDPSAELWLAGLKWPGEAGLAGHSDGDAVAHAITDALLSACGLGDIGGVFGTSDPRFVGAHGDVFLSETRRLVERAGFRIGNVSVQIIGNRPKFAPRRAEAEAALTALIGAPVSVSATTTDGLGFTGRGDGIAAIATASVVARPVG